MAWRSLARSLAQKVRRLLQKPAEHDHDGFFLLRRPGFPAADDLARLGEDSKALMQTGLPLRLYVDTALRCEWAELGL